MTTTRTHPEPTPTGYCPICLASQIRPPLAEAARMVPPTGSTPLTIHDTDAFAAGWLVGVEGAAEQVLLFDALSSRTTYDERHAFGLGVLAGTIARLTEAPNALCTDSAHEHV